MGPLGGPGSAARLAASACRRAGRGHERERTRGRRGDATSLDVHSDSPEVGAEALREAIAAELGVEVALAGSERAASAASRVTVTYRAASRELAVSVAKASNGTVTRVVEAPQAPAEIVATAALLVGNLARDQVATPPLPAPPPVAAPAPEPSRPAPSVSYVDRPVETPPRRFGNASFFYPLATNMDAPTLRTHVSFNALYGRVGEVDGLELGVFNSVSGHVSGLELGLPGNWAGGSRERHSARNRAQRRGQRGGILQASFGVNRARRFDRSAARLYCLTSGLGKPRRVFMGGAVQSSRQRTRAQVDVINVGAKVSGLLLGLVNVADDVDWRTARVGQRHAQRWRAPCCGAAPPPRYVA